MKKSLSSWQEYSCKLEEKGRKGCRFIDCYCQFQSDIGPPIAWSIGDVAFMVGA